MKKGKIISRGLLLIFCFTLASLILFSGCGGTSSATNNNAETNNSNGDEYEIIHQKDLGFDQWVEVKFYDDIDLFSDVIATAPAKCIIIPKGIQQQQLANEKGYKSLFFKDSFGHVFNVYYYALIIDVVTELPGGYMPSVGNEFSKEKYNQMWLLNENPCSGKTAANYVAVLSPGNLYLHLTPNQVNELYQK